MKENTQKLILFITSIIIPLIPLLFLYNQNKAYLNLKQVFQVFLVLIVLYALLFLLTAVIFRSQLSAFVICICITLLLFSFNNINGAFASLNDATHIGWFCIIIAASIAAAAVITAIGILVKKANMRIVSLIALVMTSVMLLFNLTPALLNAFSLGTINAARNDSMYKTEFTTSSSLDTPNVYWILCDGMLGIDAMEKYFGDTSELTQNLEDRGFQINAGAEVETAHNTMISITALMSPYYFDNSLAARISDHESAMALRNSAWFSSDEFYSALEGNEFIAAFQQKGYETTTIGLTEWWYFYPTTDRFYAITHHNNPSQDAMNSVPYILANSSSNNEYQMQAMSLAALLAGSNGEAFCKWLLNYDPEAAAADEKAQAEVHVPLTYEFEGAMNVLLGSEEAAKYHLPLLTSLNDSLITSQENTPQLTVVHYLLAHSPYLFDENGNLTDGDTGLSNYYSHYKYASRVLVNMIDMILTKDPDAVIVLQADHGIAIPAEQWLADNTDDAVSNPYFITNSVLSAIRIPEKYKTGEEKYALANPLNISRYAVNNFVGKNYEYIID